MPPVDQPVISTCVEYPTSAKACEECTGLSLDVLSCRVYLRYHGWPAHRA